MVEEINKRNLINIGFSEPDEYMCMYYREGNVNLIGFVRSGERVVLNFYDGFGIDLSSIDSMEKVKELIELLK